MWWSVPKIWQGGECWIIGGGPSVVKQFEIPDEIVQDVQSGKLSPSAYSPYMHKLHDKHVIGVNMSYKIGDWIDMMFFGDASFYKRVSQDIHTFPGLKITCALSTGKRFPNVKTLQKLASGSLYGLSTKPTAIKWNSNSGGAAINIAALTGVKKIYLLGFDMQMHNGMKHWHKMYGKGPINPPYRTHLKCFPFIARDAKKLGIEIINVNSASGIDCFPKMNLKEII